MKIIKFLELFGVIFLIYGTSLLFKVDYNFYNNLNFSIFKPSINFFQIFNFIYVILISLSISEVFYINKNDCLQKNFIIKIVCNLISFIFIKIFFNMHDLFLTFLASIFLFISLLYLYENISYFNYKSTRYLDINVLYSLLLSGFLFCLYVLNSI